MILARCTACDKRCDSKPFNTTFAWRRADGVRVAYRAILCMPCYVQLVVPLDLEYAADAALTCPNCGIETEGDYDAIYVTAFIPNYGKREIQSPFCGACAAIKRIWIQEHAQQLEDQLGATGGPNPTPTADEVLAALGIRARRP